MNAAPQLRNRWRRVLKLVPTSAEAFATFAEICPTASDALGTSARCRTNSVNVYETRDAAPAGADDGVGRIRPRPRCSC